MDVQAGQTAPHFQTLVQVTSRLGCRLSGQDDPLLQSVVVVQRLTRSQKRGWGLSSTASRPEMF